jgi:hypothetical protein
MKHIPAFFCLVSLLIGNVPAAVPQSRPARAVAWTSLADTASWQPAMAYKMCEKWSLGDTAFEGTDSWIGCNQMFGDFVLEGEFFCSGKSAGAILLRGDRDAWLPWLSGYEMEIDAADMPGMGHIQFLCRPQPSPGEARFTLGQWQHFSVRAVGPAITVKLSEKEIIRFSDDHYRFGQICLQGEKGGVRFRHLKIQPLDKTPVSGARSRWTEWFDGTSLANWTSRGTVTASNGVMTIDGGNGHAEVQMRGDSIRNGTVEVDVWCKRPERSTAPYRIGLCAADGVRTGVGYCCRSNCVLSCEKADCTSEFPMYMETKSPEYWRFELKDSRVEAYRFGERVMTCRDTSTSPRTITIQADSCVLLVRGVRYRPSASPAPAGHLISRTRP